MDPFDNMSDEEFERRMRMPELSLPRRLTNADKLSWRNDPQWRRDPPPWPDTDEGKRDMILRPIVSVVLFFLFVATVQNVAGGIGDSLRPMVYPIARQLVWQLFGH